MSTPDKRAARALWSNFDPALIGKWAGGRVLRRERHVKLMATFDAFAPTAQTDGEPPASAPPVTTAVPARASVPTPIRREDRDRVRTPLQDLYAGVETPTRRHRAVAQEFAHAMTTGLVTK